MKDEEISNIFFGIDLPKYGDTPKKYEVPHPYGYILIVTHMVFAPVITNIDQAIYTLNMGNGWFQDLVVAINSMGEVREKKFASLKKQYKGKELAIQYPEYLLNVEQQRHLPKIFALLEPKEIKVLTNSVFIIQSLNSYEIMLYQGDEAWQKDQKEFLNSLSKIK